MNADGTCLHILSVEDNAGDRLLIRRYFAAKGGRFHIHFEEDGSEATDYLFKRGAHTGAVTPDLILLDLNLQKKDGLEVLSEIKSAPETRDIPVMIFTTSQSPEDKQRCLQLGAERFITKPSDLTAFNDTFRAIEDWLEARHAAPATQKCVRTREVPSFLAGWGWRLNWSMMPVG